jgi:hypothetical protein
VEGAGALRARRPVAAGAIDALELDLTGPLGTAAGFVVFTFASVRGLRFALPICTRAIPDPATWNVS